MEKVAGIFQIKTTQKKIICIILFIINILVLPSSRQSEGPVRHSDAGVSRLPDRLASSWAARAHGAGISQTCPVADQVRLHQPANTLNLHNFCPILFHLHLISGPIILTNSCVTDHSVFFAFSASSRPMLLLFIHLSFPVCSSQTFPYPPSTRGIIDVKWFFIFRPLLL